MKRKILVLVPFSNGHDAALRFIRKMKWRKCDCDIVFCRTHQRLLERLSAGQAFAVVPVFNSTKGEVMEVTHPLAQLPETGYEFEVIAELEQQINHCLLAPKHITRVNQLERVLSKREAFEQCDAFLTKIRIPSDKRNGMDSTGEAAKYVSRLPDHIMIGAIAPKSAGLAYGLNILAEKIQDNSENFTRFQLLENKATVASLTVGIIGIKGKFGQVLEAFFKSIGCTVIGSDPQGGDMTNVKVVKKSDVVVFSVPIKETPKVIREVIRHTRPDQLLIDVTSVKQPAVKAMLRGKAQVLGLHPMFAPSVSFRGQTIVACPARLNIPRLKTWAINMLTATTAIIKWSDAVTHDKFMATVQASPQLANLVNAVVITEMGVSTKESLAFTSPYYRLMYSLMGRLLSQNPRLYCDIAMENSATIEMLVKKIEIEKRLLKILKAKNRDEFCALFETAKGHFGKEALKEANQFFMKLLSVHQTSNSPDSVTFEFERKHDQPGLLQKILRVFTRKKVNLANISSSEVADTHVHISVCFRESRDSDDVRLALEEIEQWKDSVIRIVS